MEEKGNDPAAGSYLRKTCAGSEARVGNAGFIHFPQPSGILKHRKSDGGINVCHRWFHFGIIIEYAHGKPVK
jgi:hypothetical protein